MKLSLIILAGIGLALSVQGEKVRYDNYKVYRFIPNDLKQLTLLHDLNQNNFGVIFWSEPSHVGKPVDIMFPPHLQGDTLEFLKKQIPSTIMTDNVQTLINDEARGLLQENGKLALDWDSYGRLADIYDYLDTEAARHTNIATVQTIGKSFEERDLRLLKISKPTNMTKPAIWIDGGIHAREWISPAVVTYVINQLLNNDTDPEVAKITDDFDLYVVPVLNPDGYEYTHTNQRMWRKTRATTDSPLGCRGADANRNWDYMFNTGGSSNNPCAEDYHGGTAHSQVEVQGVTNFYNTIADQTKMFLTLHSYSQLILLPYGYSNERYPDYEAYMRIGQAAADAIARPYGTEFEVGNIVDLLYPASGGSTDWVKGIHDTNIVMAFELRDTGRYGFILPPEQIKPSGHEFMEGCKELVRQLRSRLGKQ